MSLKDSDKLLILATQGGYFALERLNLLIFLLALIDFGPLEGPSVQVMVLRHT